ncbi:FAD-dependent oxidoreductase [Cyclobacterium sp. 1_MG-2023]|uniref:NAD(P)/FAD-dependent oxidoreductase n=1 Tax=Cyclobacterium sp. 1_MG-2023 TaxID=3062681 RepID=UPI0026E353DF|nr:FAD-dependent oxidoreductase [Cyclobacterium sp. 1_MG-2023]MDO6436430.1 FAD-dependent oxidoreductase [Cyclobacterium sp. 1_MG-2023]
MEVDFLLIGQGLAGTVLSYRLIQKGLKVHLIDDADPNSSSKIAAGLYNPVTGRNLVKTWKADALFKEIEPFYKEMEALLGQQFVHPIGIYRPFISFEEQNEWLAKSADPQYDAFIDKVYSASRHQGVNDPFGGLLLKSTGYIDTRKLVDSFGKWLIDKGMLTNSSLDEKDLILTKDGYWEYEGIKAKKIVFTNGIQARENSYFNWIPFIPVKGEILTVRQDFTSSEIVNRGVFRIDLGKGIGKVGSTYNNAEINLSPTEKGKKEILDKLKQLINESVVEIIDHQVGIRPGIRDRKPVLGKHPSEESVYIFGGFGAKGVSLVPYLSNQMVNLLICGEEPEKEVNINRFFKYI